MTDTVSPEITPPTQVQRLSAEALGTAVLLFLGFGAYLYAHTEAQVAAVWGVTIAVLMFCFGRVSGGHFNPAVTVGTALAGRLAWKEAGLYVVAQLVGGLVGGGLLFLLDQGRDITDHYLPANRYGKDVTGFPLWTVLLMEIIVTAIFVLIYLAATDARSDVTVAALVVGLTFTIIYLVTIPVDGGGLNPVKSLVGAIFEGSDGLKQVWLFIVAPLIGAVAAGFGYPALFGRDADRVAGSGLDFGTRTATPGYGAGGYAPQWGQQGGYAAPTPGAYPQAGAAPAVQAPQPAVEQPIIQDGWQWDPQAQQWIPAQQQQQPPAGGWPAPGQGGEQTQIRPPEGP